MILDDRKTIDRKLISFYILRMHRFTRRYTIITTITIGRKQ